MKGLCIYQSNVGTFFWLIKLAAVSSKADKLWHKKLQTSSCSKSSLSI